ncbi:MULTISPECIES: pyridoxine/pyridoxamine 5'-phosphate oxidase [Streptomyces]|uniref:pyridoxine/pyridoxamine 5'-phosphate oxidase n=1 Tax=Streptomyces TaxID=1883 RepID=UPI00045F0D21|nr:pyridoxal 5'-phosphate synthase [Streptomyces noursei]AIA02234.1 pyridoxamine 5'-phosphate oxidase [Streptomyces noursei]MCE4946129.1 pyridoxal 5'-phosphate synthase [Streptomyces noursei]
MADLRQLLRGLTVFGGELPTFDPVATPDDPVELFTAWLLGAIRAQVPEPHAMTLATADADGNPSARTLILKDVDAAGWRFAAHDDSAKGRELSARPYAALTFYWQPLARQVRVRGPVVREDAERSAADFLARGAGARAEALVGRQSRPLASLAERDAAVADAAARLARDPELVPAAWTLHTVRAESVEFWQGAEDRNHTRLAYRRSGAGWTKELRWP